MSFAVPAVLPSSQKDLNEKLALFASIPGVSRVQIDVVDGKFATPSSWPYNTDEKVIHGYQLPYLDRIAYEIDLMCLDGIAAAESWLALGATRLTFHAESVIDLSQFFSTLQKRFGGGRAFPGMASFGLALNYASPIALIEPFLAHIEYVQFMGIATIGRQGQPFERRTLERVRQFHARYPQMPIQIDGGVSLVVAEELAALGVSNVIAGSAILKASDPVAAFSKFEALKTSYGV